MMRSVVGSLLLSTAFLLGCESDKTPEEVVAVGARSAAGAIGKAGADPGTVVGEDNDDDERIPGGGLPEIEDPPIEGAATCIVADDGDPPAHDDDDPSRTGPKKPGGLPPIVKDSPKVIEGPTGSSAAGGTQRSASSGPAKTKRISKGELCATKMGSDECNPLCATKEMTWARAEGNSGTCTKVSASGNTQCGCMCE